MNYGIVGSRNRKDYESVDAFVSSIPTGSIIISGGAQGIDSFAEIAAKKYGIATKIFKPNLIGAKNYHEICDRYYTRNKKIVENSDIIIAFVSHDRKGGTENTIKYALKMGVGVQIVPPSAASE